MGKLRNGAINFSKLQEAEMSGHSAFFKTKSGDIWFNISQWENDQPDQYGNSASIQLNSAKDKRETEKKVYIGNIKADKNPF